MDVDRNTHINWQNNLAECNELRARMRSTDETYSAYVQVCHLQVYGRRRMKALSTQQQAIVMAIFQLQERGEDPTVTKIADQAWLSGNLITSQLYNILPLDYVERSRSGRESIYRISDEALVLALKVSQRESVAPEQISGATAKDLAYDPYHPRVLQGQKQPHLAFQI